MLHRTGIPGALRALARAAVVVLAGLAAPAAADPPDHGIAQYGIDRWNARDGLPGNWVHDVVEDVDGSLWVATAGGLARFDGRRFERVAPGRDDALGAVIALDRGIEGRLWMATEFGGIRIARADGALVDAGLAALPAGVLVRDLLVEAGAGAWVATREGLWHVDANRAQRIAPPGVAPATEVRTLVRGADGAIWARSVHDGLWRVADGEARAEPDVPQCAGHGVAVGRDDERYVSCLDGVWRWDAGARRWLRLSLDAGVGRLLLDRQGSLWFGGQQGLTRWHHGIVEVLAVERGLGDWRLRAFAEDSHGDLWLGTFSAGLSRLHRGPVRAWGVPEGLSVRSVTAVLAGDDGGYWIGALEQGLQYWHPQRGTVVRYSAADGLPGRTAWALARDVRHPGALWIGTEHGLAWLHEGRIALRDPQGRGSSSDVRLLFADPADPTTLWIASEAPGASALTDARPAQPDPASGLEGGRVRFFLRRRDGGLWAGGEAGLFRFASGRWIAHTEGDADLRGLTAATEDDEGTLWVAGTRGGLVRIGDAPARSYRTDDGLPFQPVHSLAFDAAGGLWMSGNEGLARLRRDDHRRWRRGGLERLPVELLLRRDGLREPECNGWGSPSVDAAPGGRLVYPTLDGLALLDPGALSTGALLPAEVRVRAARTGDRELPLVSPLRLGRDERALRIAFSAIELLRPEAVSFRYRLDGFDPDWVPAGSDAEAAWSRLAPGRFALRVQARLPGQDWVDAQRPLDVVVVPQPWESRWLQALAALAIVGIALALSNWRVRIERGHAASLARARELLREVIDTSPNPIFARRRDGAYTLANRAAAAVYGLPPEALEGRAPDQLGAQPDGMAAIDALDAEVIASGQERIANETEIVGADGRRRWFRVVKRPGYGADGRSIEQVIGTAVDVTDFKLAAQRLHRERERLKLSRERARRLSRRLLRAQEDERRRLAREIHDDLTQQLAGLSLLAWGTAQTAARDPGRDLRPALEELAGELERVTNGVQALSRELHPPALESLGLGEALRAECATFGKRTGLAVGFARRGDFADPPPEVGIALYRIVQEALRNALAHADCRRIDVTLAGDPDALVLTVADDGRGFDPATTRVDAGLGLGSMRERARLAGGRLSIDSTPGRGTRVFVEWTRPAATTAGAAEPTAGDM